MNKRKLSKLEKRVPARAVAALDAAHRRAVASGVPLVMVLDGNLYRVSAAGRELIRTLPPRTKVPGGVKAVRA